MRRGYRITRIRISRTRESRVFHYDCSSWPGWRRGAIRSFAFFSKPRMVSHQRHTGAPGLRGEIAAMDRSLERGCRSARIVFRSGHDGAIRRLERAAAAVPSRSGARRARGAFGIDSYLRVLGVLRDLRDKADRVQVAWREQWDDRSAMRPNILRWGRRFPRPTDPRGSRAFDRFHTCETQGFRAKSEIPIEARFCDTDARCGMRSPFRFLVRV